MLGVVVKQVHTRGKDEKGKVTLAFLPLSSAHLKGMNKGRVGPLPAFLSKVFSQIHDPSKVRVIVGLWATSSS